MRELIRYTVAGRLLSELEDLILDHCQRPYAASWIKPPLAFQQTFRPDTERFNPDYEAKLLKLLFPRSEDRLPFRKYWRPNFKGYPDARSYENLSGAPDGYRWEDHFKDDRFALPFEVSHYSFNLENSLLTTTLSARLPRRLEPNEQLGRTAQVALQWRHTKYHTICGIWYLLRPLVK